MNKKDLIKNFKDYTPEQIAKAIKSGIVSSYDLIHETGGAYTPLLKKKVKLALEKLEQERDNPTETPRPIKDVEPEVSSQEEIAMPSIEIPSLEQPLDINDNVSDNQTKDAPTTNLNDKKLGMFSNPFSFNGRIRRTEYGITLIIGFLINIILNAIIASASQSSSDASGLFVLYFVILIPYSWFALAQGAKRCHDRGNSGWYQLIPFYGFWLLFAEGEPSTNNYGVSPK